ncbi:MAG TPA: hypothetical protein VG796_06320 [Verrucomicrobiales bacterium]|jgi:hypothetical protein|nr:hypothetical protein [Verrucomicrobiales bacterium]
MTPEMPAPTCTVRFDDRNIQCEYSDGRTERITWESLQEVLIRTLDAGLSFTDIFWVLMGSSAQCIIPHGSEGDSALLERLQKLPGFNNDVFIAAMSSISDGEFVCWRRPAQS